jgi:hypothetical protein
MMYTGQCIMFWMRAYPLQWGSGRELGIQNMVVTAFRDQRNTEHDSYRYTFQRATVFKTWYQGTGTRYSLRKATVFITC